MARDTEPTELELLLAMHRRVLQKAEALERAIDAARQDESSNLAPRGCERAVDGITCSPSMWRHVCLLCGLVLRRCARHGGDRAVRAELAKHQWQAHGVDDREGGIE